MKNKRNLAERLFDNIGGINDRYIAEAQSYRGAYRRSVRNRAAVIAIAAVLAVVLLFGALPLAVSIIMSGNASTPGVDDGMGENVSYSSLSDLLVSHSTGMTPLSATPDLSDGTARLVWSVDGRLYSVDLTKTELSELTSDMLRSRGGQPTSHTTQVWLCFGDGRVVSPELRNSSGNIGYGTLFSYSAEIEPSPAVINCIRNIIET